MLAAESGQPGDGGGPARNLRAAPRLRHCPCRPANQQASPSCRAPGRRPRAGRAAMRHPAAPLGGTPSRPRRPPARTTARPWGPPRRATPRSAPRCARRRTAPATAPAGLRPGRAWMGAVGAGVKASGGGAASRTAAAAARQRQRLDQHWPASTGGSPGPAATQQPWKKQCPRRQQQQAAAGTPHPAARRAGRPPPRSARTARPGRPPPARPRTAARTAPPAPPRCGGESGATSTGREWTQGSMQCVQHAGKAGGSWGCGAPARAGSAPEPRGLALNHQPHIGVDVLASESARPPGGRAMKLALRLAASAAAAAAWRRLPAAAAAWRGWRCCCTRGAAAVLPGGRGSQRGGRCGAQAGARATQARRSPQAGPHRAAVDPNETMACANRLAARLHARGVPAPCSVLRARSKAVARHLQRLRSSVGY